jgi:hypothetical protein
MNVTIVVTIAAFLAALGAWLLAPGGTGSQAVPAVVAPAASGTEQSRAVEEALRSLKAERATLRRDYDRITQRLRATEAALKRLASLNAQSGTSSNTEEDGADTPTGTGKELSEEEQITATLDELDLRLDQEPEDPTWSQSTEMEVTAFLHSDGMEGSHVLSADCQSSLCRVEVAHEDASAQGWLIDHLPMEPPFDGEVLIRQVDADSAAPRTLVYLSRSGQSLLSAIP